MRLARPFVITSLAAAATIAACTLNPQPLPPSDGSEKAGFDNDAAVDAGGFSNSPTTNPPGTQDAAAPLDSEGGVQDSGDGGDAGDAGITDASDAG